jgi:two-component system sensor histidine kinase/response regulator
MADENQKMILIVDDTPRNLQLLAEILYGEGYEIGVADNGQAALDYLAEIKPDIILLDIMMPGIDGYETCHRIKDNPAWADIPIIFLSAKAEKESIVKGFRLGAADYVTKPFNATELIARVKTHLELKAKREELANMNIKLEHLVDQRTAQLQIANKKLNELDQTKSYFIGLVSHELNTPLTGILGGATIIQQTTKDEETKEFIGMVMSSAERLKRFSDVSRLIADLSMERYHFSVDKGDINAFFNNLVEEFAKNNTKKKISFVNNIPNDELEMAMDYSLMSQAIERVLDNSYKYTTEGSIIVSALFDDNNYYLKIQDTGCGFSEIALQNAFTMFQSDELMNHSEGLGLSLTVSKLIINYHQGEIKVENNKNGGACVTIILPMI